MWPPHDTERMWVEDHPIPPPCLVAGQSNSPNLRLYIRSWWAMFKTHTCCISGTALQSQPREPGEGTETLLFSQQE